ncbi:MAG: SUMF1/EgtB/PvdO family nonheme iron enzyme [Methyloligellaceae bacterium]
MTSDQLKQEIEQHIQAVRQAPARITFKDLIKVAHLDPSEDFRYCNFAGVDFSGEDLHGIDLTGANLAKCNFDNSRINGARFDAANLTGSDLKKARDWREYQNTWKRSDRTVDADHLRVSNVFRDAPFAPELVVIPSDQFLMGSAEGRDSERPQHEVTIDYCLAVGRFAVMFEEWDFYISRNPKAYKPDDQGWGRERRPVINVSWDDAKGYVQWLSEMTGKAYRLLSEAEWEYACRAGTATEYSFGDGINQKQAQYSEGDYGSAKHTVSVGSFDPNPFGLYDMHGNVWEWCEDDWHKNYIGAPSDGSARVEDNNGRGRVLRGGSWDVNPQFLRARDRDRFDRVNRNYGVGFRVARALASS